MSALPVKRLLAYCDPWSARPGETIGLHVSSDGPYELSIVRMTGGAAAGGAPIVVDHPAAGRYDGTARPLPCGSYGEVDGVPGWPGEGDFGIDLFVMPTLPRLGRPQTIASGPGFWLGLDGDGRFAATTGHAPGAAGAAVVVSAVEPHEGRWYRVELRVSPARGSARLSVTSHAAPLDRAAVDEGTGAFPAAAGGTLRFGATAAGDRVIDHLNGRLAAPRCLDAEGEPVVRWDLAERLDQAAVPGHGPAAATLRFVNTPVRAVPGPDWDGSAHSPVADPAHYDAVHLHDDDLEDALWPHDAEIAIPAGLRSGFHAAVLRTADEETVVPFFVRPAVGEGAAVTLLASTATYLAYANMRTNTDSTLSEYVRTMTLNVIFTTIAQRYDLGPSLYDSHRDGSPCFVVSRRRPLLTVTTAGPVWSWKADLDVVGWLEHAGIDYDVLTEEDLHREGPAALAECRCVIAPTHSEYWSTSMWDAISAFVEGGGRLMNLGGNAFYWRVSHPPDRPWLMECRRAESGARFTAAPPGTYHHQYGGELGGLWRRIGRTPQSMIGVGMTGQGWDDGTPYHFNPCAGEARAAFLVDGIDLAVPFGAHGAFGFGGGAAGGEIDRADPALGTPEHALVLASSGPHSAYYYLAPEETLFANDAIPGEVAPHLRADLVFFETRGGGAVFSTGSIAWSESLATDGYDNDVARMTTNAVRRMADPEPFPVPAD